METTHRITADGQRGLNRTAISALNEWKYGVNLQTWLRAELAGGKSKSKRLLHGVLGYRTKPAGVSVTDPAAALVWAQENLPAAVTLTLDKKTLAEALLTTGEALDFAKLNPAEETFYIK